MLWRLLVGFIAFTIGAVLLIASVLRVIVSDSVWEEIAPQLGLAAVVGTLLACLPAWLLARRFVRPLQLLTEGAQRIAEGDYAHRISGGTWGESRMLARTFNKMSKRLETQFRQLESDREQLRTILGGMVEGVIAVDSSQRILFANERAGQMLEFNPMTAVSRPFWEVTRQPQILEVLQRALTGSEPCHEELDSKGANARNLVLYVAPLPRENDSGAVMVLHDTTELRRLERMRQDFAANVSHELKTPLTVIRSHIEALLDGAVDDPDARKPFLEQIASSSERLHALIIDLLSLSKIESGELPFDIKPISLEHAILDCLERHHPRAEAKGLELTYREPGDDANGDSIVLVDEEALDQILDNLVDNAVKYTQPGGRIEVSWTGQGEHVRLSVRDSGPGIPERDLPRIFERFYRVDKARSREVGGTGLGLAIVKHLVQEMKGSVNVMSQVGVGTCFQVVLPRANRS